jgi:hypothetical protein
LPPLSHERGQAALPDLFNVCSKRASKVKL